MKSFTQPIVAVLVLVTVVACIRREIPLPPDGRRGPAPPPAPEISPALVVELQKRIEAEREIRTKLENRVVEQEKAKSHWQSGALLAVTGAILLLIVGTILGSRARHDAQN